MALMYRFSVRPVVTRESIHASGASGGTVHGCGTLMMRLGVPILHCSTSSNLRGGGRSAGLPLMVPPSTHAAIVAISASLSEISSLNFWMPTFFSMCHGGISRATTRRLIDRAQGRASSYVISDIGAIDSGRWHVWQER